ncbi:MAG: hypothetical protein A2Y12_05960 [Planctomycetes bacterium GWF2_42_9]|nr:MAG: hypothetical protein A2Y12_05960 [Planctomycetes bacterium GWF2_42_9]
MGVALDGSVFVGTPMHGMAIYDIDAPDITPSDTGGNYAVNSITMTIGNYVFSDMSESAGFSVNFNPVVGEVSYS